MSYPTCLLTLQKQQIWNDLPQTTINKAIERLSQTSVRVCFGRWWTFCAYYV